VLFGLLIVVAGGYFWQKASYEKRLGQMQHDMLATIDSIPERLGYDDHPVRRDAGVGR